LSVIFRICFSLPWASAAATLRFLLVSLDIDFTW
jgi:hypothetical protein